MKLPQIAVLLNSVSALYDVQSSINYNNYKVLKNCQKCRDDLLFKATALRNFKLSR